MNILYHDILEQQFEALVHAICVFLLGEATQKFSSGPDGGRDARFAGRAQRFPNSANPLAGKFIVQAKHTEDPIAKVSDPEFSSSADYSVISKELPRIRTLRRDGQLDHYILYTNRRAGGRATEAVEDRIRKECSLDSVTLFGIETLDTHLKLFPGAVALAGILDYVGPLRVIPDDLAELVVALSDEIGAMRNGTHPLSLNREAFAEKNERNDLPEETAQQIVSLYMPDFAVIDRWLQNPANNQRRHLYDTAATEFNAEILEKRAEGARMDSLLNHLVYRLMTRDRDLSRNKRLTRTMIYYMYYMCDIGSKP